METLPDGQVHAEEAFNMRDPEGRAVAEKLIRATADLKRRMAPPGVLLLPALLEARRWQYGIPNGAFRYQFCFDNVSVFQLPMVENNGKFGDTSIIQPEVSVEKEKLMAPRGVIVSAGLKALDELRTHGMDLGHIVLFSRLSPFRYICDFYQGHAQEIIILTAGDCRASEDTAKLVQAGLLRVVWDEDDGQHKYVETATGKALTPIAPDQPADFT